MRLAAAAVRYFAVVFVASFLLGSIRMFWLEPRMEKALAVLCDTPFLLLAMVLGALVLQQIADLIVGSALRGLTLSQQLQNFETPAGTIYAALLLMFAAMPLLVNCKGNRQT